MSNINVKWGHKAKQQLVTTSRHHMLARYYKIKSIVHQNPELTHFNLSQSQIHRMTKDIENAILSWKGVDIDLCQKKKETFKEYKRTCTNWFNRNKPKIFGNYFFYPLIFNHILKSCVDLKNGMDDNAKMILFIDILIVIFESDIKFANTKKWPLLPYQTIIQRNKFKVECLEFIKHFKIEWNANSVSPDKIGMKYQRDKKRSKKIFESFTECLLNIKQKLNSNIYPIYTVISSTSHHYNDMNESNIKYEANSGHFDGFRTNLVENRNDINYQTYNDQQTQSYDQLINILSSLNGRNSNNSNCSGINQVCEMLVDEFVNNNALYQNNSICTNNNQSNSTFSSMSPISESSDSFMNMFPVFNNINNTQFNNNRNSSQSINIHNQQYNEIINTLSGLDGMNPNNMISDQQYNNDLNGIALMNNDHIIGGGNILNQNNNVLDTDDTKTDYKQTVNELINGFVPTKPSNITNNNTNIRIMNENHKPLTVRYQILSLGPNHKPIVINKYVVNP